MLLPSPCLRLGLHSTYHIWKEAASPQNPQLVHDGLEGLGGVLNNLNDRLVGRTFR